MRRPLQGIESSNEHHGSHDAIGAKKFVGSYDDPRRLWWAEGSILVILPLAVLLLGPFQLFPPPGWVDAGMYLGYFLDFPRKLAEFGQNYHAMRLTYTLTGFLVHRILSPDFANYFLVLGFHYLALFSVYFAVRARHSRAVAVSAVLFLAVNPLWIAAVTQGYVDGPGMAFLFACLACLANRGGTIPVRTGAVLAGAAAGLAANCHAYAGLFTVFTALSWLVAEKTSWRDLWWTSLYALAGATIATLGLGLASRLLGGRFLFFLVNVDFGRHALKGFGKFYSLPLGEWVPSAYRLALPLAFLAVGLIFLRGRREIGPSAHLLAAGCSTLILSIVWFLILDFGIGGSNLQFAHYTSYLVPGQCLVFAGLAALLLPRDEVGGRWPRWAIVGAGLLVAGIVPLINPERLWALEAASRPIYVLWCVIALLFAVAAGLLRHRASGMGLAILMFATVLAGTANADTRRIFRVGPNPDHRPFYELLVQLNWVVDSIRALDRPLYIWYCRECLSPSQRNDWLVVELAFMGRTVRTNMLDSMASLWLWDLGWLNYAMPSLSGEDLERLTAAPRGSTLVMLCPEENVCADAKMALDRAGVTTRQRARVPLSARGLLDLNVLIMDVSRTGTGM
jgi:hypothetical protein